MGLKVVPGQRPVGLVGDCIGMIVGTCHDHCPLHFLRDFFTLCLPTQDTGNEKR